MKTPISNDNLAALLNAGTRLSLFIWEDVRAGGSVRVRQCRSAFGLPERPVNNRDIEYQSLVHEEDLPGFLKKLKRSPVLSLESLLLTKTTAKACQWA